MLSKERTTEILKQFSQECYNFWRREGCGHEEATEKMIKDLKCTKHDPYVPCGELLDVEAKEEFIRKEMGVANE